jgi:hypothetical protein
VRTNAWAGDVATSAAATAASVNARPRLTPEG